MPPCPVGGARESRVDVERDMLHPQAYCTGHAHYPLTKQTVPSESIKSQASSQFTSNSPSRQSHHAGQRRWDDGRPSVPAAADDAATAPAHDAAAHDGATATARAGGREPVPAEQLGGQRRQHAAGGCDADHDAHVPDQEQHPRRVLAGHAVLGRRQARAAPRRRPHHARPAPAQVLGVLGGKLDGVRGVDADDAEPAGAHAGGLAPRPVVLRGGLLKPGAFLQRVAVQVAPVTGHHRLGGRRRLPVAHDQRPVGAPGAHQPFLLLHPRELSQTRISLSLVDEHAASFVFFSLCL